MNVNLLLKARLDTFPDGRFIIWLKVINRFLEFIVNESCTAHSRYFKYLSR